jgi:sulfate transport system substrate-binding protein
MRLRTGLARLALGGALILTTAAVAGCGGSSDVASSSGSGSSASSSSGSATLNLVGYSTPQKAYDALQAAFAKTSAGKGVGFTDSFGASGSQARAVASGQSADVVAFSTTPDMDKVVQAGDVASGWADNPEHGFSSDSVVALIVRKDNPKHITGWSDLLKPGIQVVTANPSTSGSARWNILAAYGAQLKQGKTPAQALAYVRTLIIKHVVVQDASGADALQTFLGGKGDVLIDYESSALAARRAGDPVTYVVPKQTLLIQTPIAVTKTTKHAAQANAFLKYQWSKAGQTIWAEQGYRPVDPAVAKQFASTFPTPAQLFTISYLGGWSSVTDKFFAPSTGLITKIEVAAGVPTASS